MAQDSNRSAGTPAVSQSGQGSQHSTSSKQPPIEGGQGLRGPDKQQGDLRDVSSGTNQAAHIEEARTARMDAQPGADVRGPITGETVHELPEGLKRERKGPLDKHEGRNEVPSQVPSHNPKGGER